VEVHFEEHLDIDSNPEEEEQGSKAHEEAGHPGDHQLLGQLPCELGRRHLIDEEPSSEEETNAKATPMLISSSSLRILLTVEPLLPRSSSSSR